MTQIDPKATPTEAYKVATSPGSDLGRSISQGEYASIQAAFNQNRSIGGVSWLDWTQSTQQTFLKGVVQENPALAQAIKDNQDYWSYFSARNRQQNNPELENRARERLVRELSGEQGVAELAPRQRLPPHVTQRIDQLSARFHANVQEIATGRVSDAGMYIDQVNKSLQSGEARDLVNELAAMREGGRLTGRKLFPDAEALVRAALIDRRR